MIPVDPTALQKWEHLRDVIYSSALPVFAIWGMLLVNAVTQRRKLKAMCTTFLRLAWTSTVQSA